MSRKRRRDVPRGDAAAPLPPAPFAEPASSADHTGEGPLSVAVLAIVVVAGFLLRLVNLSRPMDYDEAFTYLYYASRPLGAALRDYSLPNNHVFHTLLVHVSTGLFGNHPWAVRLPAFVAGVALVPAAYFWARRFFGGGAALLAAALVATSEPLVAYSTNARGYTILGLCFLLAFIFAARAIEANRPSDWIVFVIVSAAGLYTIPTMIYGLGSIALWMLAEILLGRHGPARRVLLRNAVLALLAGAALAAAAYVPLWLHSGFGLVKAMAFDLMPWPRFFRWLGASFGEVWAEWNGSIPAGVSVVLLLCFVAGIVLHRRVSTYRVSPALPALFWPEMLLFFQRTAPFSRVWLYLLPLYLGTASAGVAALLSFRRWNPAARRVLFASAALLTTIGLGALVMAHSRRYDSERIDLVAEFLAGNLETGDFLGAHGYLATPMAYYLVARHVPVERVSAQWKLEILRVAPTSAAATREASSRPPRAFFVIRPDDAELLHALRESARLAGVASHLHRLRRFGATTIYEDPEVAFARPR